MFSQRIHSRAFFFLFAEALFTAVSTREYFLAKISVRPPGTYFVFILKKRSIGSKTFNLILKKASLVRTGSRQLLLHAAHGEPLGPGWHEQRCLLHRTAVATAATCAWCSGCGRCRDTYTHSVCRNFTGARPDDIRALDAAESPDGRDTHTPHWGRLRSLPACARHICSIVLWPHTHHPIRFVVTLERFIQLMRPCTDAVITP